MTLMKAMDTPQQYCLRWKYHHSNLQTMFSQLLERECLCDVTLACEGKTLKAHKVMLSACSTYFDSIFSQYEENNPIVILKDVRFSDIKALVQFMYRGEINVDNSELTSLLKTAEELRIKGLAEVSWRSDNEMEEEEDSGDEDQPPLKKNKKTESSPSKVVSTIDTLPEECKDSPQESPEDEMDDSDAEDIGWESDRNRSDSISHYEDSVNKESVSPPSAAVPSMGVSVPNVVSSPPPLIPTSSGSVTISTLDDDKNSTTTSAVPNTAHTDTLSNTPVDLSQFPDIMKMNEYLDSGGRRPQFWEEPFTKRLMEAIKNKEVEMKVAAELMGVSYGTLYGRYRDAYGCLKHPYRVRDFWSEQGPAEVLAKLQRKELTLFRAAEMLNVTVTTLANYLSTLKQGHNSASDNDDDDDDDANTTDNEEAVHNERDDNADHKYSPSSENNHDVVLTFVKRDNPPTTSNLNGS